MFRALTLIDYLAAHNGHYRQDILDLHGIHGEDIPIQQDHICIIAGLQAALDILLALSLV